MNLTLDMLAAMAMQAILGNAAYVATAEKANLSNDEFHKQLASRSYEIARALQDEGRKHTTPAAPAPGAKPAELMTTIEQFVAECCVVAPGRTVSRKKLFNAYQRWSENKHGERGYAVEYVIKVICHMYPVAVHRATKHLVTLTGIEIKPASAESPS